MGITIPLLVFAVVLTIGWVTSDPDDVATPTATAAPVTTGAPAPGSGDIDAVALTTSQGCAACHSTDGSVLLGPSWQGLAGSERTFEDGTTAIADEAYLRESIIDPGARVVAGFAPVMPPGYGDQLSDAELSALVAYIQTLG